MCTVTGMNSDIATQAVGRMVEEFKEVEKRKTTTIMMDFSEQVSAIAMQMSPGACNLVSQ